VIVRIAAKRASDGRMLLEISNWLKHGGKEELPAATHEGTGLGIANVCQRLEARFGNRAQCRFGPMASGGYKVSILIPIESHG
jgi:two-component system, LytTR family, sensor kinase